MEFLAIIKSSPIFSGLTDSEITSILDCLKATTENYAKGNFIWHSGSSIETVGLLLSGQALIVQEDFWGNQNLMSNITPSQLFGESFACSPGAVLNISIIAAADCRVMFLKVPRILTTCPTTCSHHSRLIRNLLTDLAHKNLSFNEKLTHLSKRSTREKLLSYLSSESQRRQELEFEIPFNRQQLADYLSVDRSAMSAELGKLRKEGKLDFFKNHFTLHLN